MCLAAQKEIITIPINDMSANIDLMGFFIMEIWRDVKGYEGIYQISNYGNAKSLKFGKERSLKFAINNGGYRQVSLCVNSNNKAGIIHQLVAVAFLNHVPDGHKLVINHIDFNKLNNHINNLEVVTNRENCNYKHIKSSSKYVGVGWSKHANKWRAAIYINGKQNNLGYFNNEIDAHNKYQQVLETL